MTLEQQNTIRKVSQAYTQSRHSSAARLHTEVAQPIIAARLFTQTILDEIEQKVDHKELLNTAKTIHSMLNEAFEAAYDLMRETELVSNKRMSFSDSLLSFKQKLKGGTCTINFSQNFLEQESKYLESNIEAALKQLVLDAILKRILIYLNRRHAKNSLSLVINLEEQFLQANLSIDFKLEPDSLEELGIVKSTHKELAVIGGNLIINTSNKSSSFNISVPLSI